MVRVSLPPTRAGGIRAGAARWFTRRALERLAGRPTRPDQIVTPLRLYAHLPGVLRAYARLEQATAATHRLDRRHRALAELMAATTTRCRYCVDLGSEVARRWGVTDRELLELTRYPSSSLFTEAEKLLLRYAAGISQTPVDVPDEMVARLRQHFADAQIVELTHICTLENLRARFNLALGIEPAGFSHDRVCTLVTDRTQRPS